MTIVNANQFTSPRQILKIYRCKLKKAFLYIKKFTDAALSTPMNNKEK